MVRNRSNLRGYQDKSIAWVLPRKCAGLIMDMGLGKTVIVETVIADLLHTIRAMRYPALVVGPIRVIKTVWRQEAAKWTHTQGLRFSLVYGDIKKRLRALQEPADVYLINPHNIRWLVGGPRQSDLGRMVDELDLTFSTHKLLMTDKTRELPGVAKVLKLQFGMLVVDESSLFKDPSTQRFKALRSVVPEFERRLILTGTPRPQSMLNMWSQAFILDGGQRLGTSFYRFRERFFTKADYEGHSWELRPGAEDYIHRLLQDIMLRLDAKDWLQLPPTISNPVYVELPDEAMVLYKEFEREMVIKLRQSGREVTAANMAVYSGKAQQVSNGALYYEDAQFLLYHPESEALWWSESFESDGTVEDVTGIPEFLQRAPRRPPTKKWELIHDAKLEAVQEIVDEAGAPIIVCYHFQHDIHRLRTVFPEAPVFTETKNLDKLIKEFGEGKHPVLLMHTASSGHGIDGLQHSCNRICFFSLTWSQEAHDQIIARIGGARQVGLAENVLVYYVIARDTIDEVILETNGVNAEDQRRTLNAFRAHVMESGVLQ